MKKTTRKSIIGIIIFLAMSSPHAVDETIPHPIDERGLLSDIAIKTTKLFRPVEAIAIKGGKLEKTELTVESGTVVVIENHDNTNHRLIFPPASQNIMVMEFVSTVIQQGDKWGAEFLDPGEYPFNCSLHPEQEHGVVKVIEKSE